MNKNIPEIPVAEFELVETTTKHRGGSGHLQLKLCNSDFDWLCERKFNGTITVRNNIANAGHENENGERIAERVMRIINEQDGYCDLVNKKARRSQSRISVRISDVTTNPARTLVRFSVTRN